MSDPENFIARWSRRKRDANAGATKEPAKNSLKPEDTGSPEAADSVKAGAECAVPAPQVDLDKLPPIESIDSSTDISAFMRSGVPDSLRYAALRRAWSSDPGIRDFVEMNENFWEAAGPDGIPGFGALDPNFDVKRMISGLFGEKDNEEARPSGGSESLTDGSNGPHLSASEEAESGQRSADSVAYLSDSDAGGAPNVAAQNESPSLTSEPASPTNDAKTPPKRGRRHGGAMPQ
ncbi:MAG TPA: DUF3306 domain-containing protein [Pseudolabrys sp.]|nr:DUF3306 domain-containing protein [Pseudolabrys sp.]